MTTAASGPGVALLAGVTLFAAIGPLVAAGDPQAQDLMGALAAPSAAHWLGTDHLGRDVLARLAHGASRSLATAVVSVGGAVALGLGLGLVAAAGGRWVDGLVMRLVDLMLAFPGLLLVLLLAGFLGGGQAPMLIGLVLTQWPHFARMARNVGSLVLAEPHVEAARLAGFPTSTILWRHVLPVVIRRTAPLATLGFGSAVMAIAALGFLGLGLQPPTPEWGAMISELLPHLDEAPVQMAAPCVAIFLTVLGATLLGERASAYATSGRSDDGS